MSTASVSTVSQQADDTRVALVTGGSRGIGRQSALRLAKDGFAVVIGYAGNKDEAEAAVAQITEAGGRALSTQADVADENAVAAMSEAAESAFGGVDVVVNAAGRMDLATVVDFDLSVLDTMLRTNIRGTFVVAQQAARRLRPGGAIITFSSSVLGLNMPTYAGYA
ncbi:MAG: SDR family NAD(P)-dependent oxidoreductase, partial [Actinocrinis sp.]